MKNTNINDFLEDGMAAVGVHGGGGPVPDFRSAYKGDDRYYADTYEWVARTHHGYYRGNMLSRRGVFDKARSWAEECKAKTLLEVACGNGDGVRRFRGSGLDAYGVDVNLQLLSSSSMAVAQDFLAAADARRLPFSSDSFDFLVSVDFLEHVREDELPLVLSELRRVARSGFLVISCVDAVNKGPDGKSLHETVRAPAWWRENLCASGFDIALEQKDGTAVVFYY